TCLATLCLAGFTVADALVFASCGVVVTVCLSFAEMFGKEHYNIIRDFFDTISILACLQHYADVDELGFFFITL
ncbi:hypothetical protein ACIKK6_06255, partial [Bacillus thuringiensis]